MAQNIDLFPDPIDESVLYDQKRHISEKIWMTPLSDKKKDIHNYQYFPEIDDYRVLYKLNVAGFYGLYSLGSRKVDNHLITALIERWRPETTTFHFPSSELTMTLQDVDVLAGVKIDERALIYDETGFTKNQREALINHFLGPVVSYTITRDGLISFKWLKQICESLSPLSSMDEVVRVTRVCILLIIGSVYLRDNQGTGVGPHYLLYMEDLNICGQYSWGSAISGYLYRSLYKTTIIDTDSGKEISGVTGALQLLQYWAWSRFTFMRPFYQDDLPNDDIPLGGLPAYPYGRRLAKCKLTYQMGSSSHSVRMFRDQFDQLSPLHVTWESYPNVDALPACSKAGRSIWLARVPLICTSIVEFHHPDRVMRQFGFRQMIPSTAVRPVKVRAISRKGRSSHNWVHRFAQYIATWDSRTYHVPNGEFHFDLHRTNDDYMGWYLRITRRWIGKPTPEPPAEGPHPTVGRMGLLVQEWNKKYARAVQRGNNRKIQQCLAMFTQLGVRPPEIQQPSIDYPSYAEPPQQPPTGCYIPDMGNTGFPTSDPPYPYHDQTSQWGQRWDQPNVSTSQWGEWNQANMDSSQWRQWNQPNMASSSFAADRTEDFFNQLHDPNNDFPDR